MTIHGWRVPEIRDITSIRFVVCNDIPSAAKAAILLGFCGSAEAGPFQGVPKTYSVNLRDTIYSWRRKKSFGPARSASVAHRRSR